jgi:predicted extracellular nuclease
MKHIGSLLVVLAVLLSQNSFCQSSLRVGFYNVENLFDTIDDPTNAQDDEFTPQGRLNWTPDRYQKKLDGLEQVIGAMQYPAILGLCEVENAKVIEDLIRHKGMASKPYSYQHVESPRLSRHRCSPGV